MPAGGDQARPPGDPRTPLRRKPSACSRDHANDANPPGHGTPRPKTCGRGSRAAAPPPPRGWQPEGEGHPQNLASISDLGGGVQAEAPCCLGPGEDRALGPSEGRSGREGVPAGSELTQTHTAVAGPATHRAPAHRWGTAKSPIHREHTTHTAPTRIPTRGRTVPQRPHPEPSPGAWKQPLATIHFRAGAHTPPSTPAAT